MIKRFNPTDWEGERLIFAMTTDDNFTVENKDYEMLGTIERIRIGTFMQWCLFLESRCFLSPGCQDEVREMCRILKGLELKKLKE